MEHHEATDGLNTPAVVVSGVVAAIVTCVLVVGLQILYLQFRDQQQDRNQSDRPAGYGTSALAEQTARLNRYGWLDRERGLVAIPIDRAIELTAEDLQENAGEGAVP